MKSTLSLFFSFLLSLFVAIFINVIRATSEYDLSYFLPAAFFAIGSLIVSFTVGTTYLFFLNIFNKKISGKDYIIVALLTLLTATLIYLGFQLITRTPML